MSPPARAHGPTVHALRHARGLRLDDLAVDADSSKGHLSYVERGRYRASPALTDRLAAALKVRREILTGQVPPIATLREISGVPLADLAAAAGVTTSRLTRIERGTERPHPDELARIATRLSVDPAALDAAAEPAEAAS